MLAKTLILIAALFSVAPGTQERSLLKIPEQKLERELVADAEGLKQFAPYEVKCEACRGTGEWECLHCKRFDNKNETCMECEVTRKATCRLCAGNKVLHDPIEAIPCLFCTYGFDQGGSGFVNCGLCQGGGELGVTDKDGNKTSQKCGSCKGEGRFPCAVCDGSRIIPTVKVKKKPATEAKAKDLHKVRDGLAAVLVEFEGFEPIARSGKNDKKIEGFIKKHKKTFPPLSGMFESLETIAGGQTKAGAGFAAYEQNLVHTYKVFRDKTIYLLRHQLLVLDACIERAEFNEKQKEQALQQSTHAALETTIPWH